MQRWHLTLGLTGLAIGAAFLAPRLTTLLQPTPPPPPAAADAVPQVVSTLPAEATGHLVVDAGLDRSAVLSGRPAERYLTVSVSAPGDLGVAERRPVDLSVVIDASGSMSARGKIDNARQAAKLLASRMERGDTYSLVVFADDASVVVPATAVQDVAAIHRQIDRVFEGGGTNLYAGLERGLREVRRSLPEGAVGRLIVLSDGNANVGVVDPNALSRFAADAAASGVAVSTIGLGLDYNEDLLARLADLGGGTYDFVDDPSALGGVFTDELQRTASVVARGTRVRIDLPPGVRPVEVIGWDATRTADGWEVFLGDVYAGDTRKIVTRVTVDGALPLGDGVAASVAAHYDDLVDGRGATSRAVAPLRVTGDPRVVDASLDRARAVEATRAAGSWYLEMSTRAYAEGDRDQSRQLLGAGRALLDDAARDLKDDSLAAEASALEQTGQVFELHAPASDGGRRAIKTNKERFRDLAR